jgi:FKBP-type peptidyl-prolyl cis-trans isomerase FklB
MMLPSILTRPLSLILLGTCLSITVQAAELDSDRARYSYTLGIQVGEKLKSRGLDVDPAAFADAIEDVLAGNKLRMTPEQRQKALDLAEEEAANKHKQQADANSKAGATFRAAYAKKDGVKSLDKGVLYRVLKPGKGPSPSADSAVEVHYRGAHTDGREFDSSLARKEPATFQVSQVIPGFSAALKKMSVGAKWEVVIPPDQAYGEQGAGSRIGPQETLVFELELLGIK